MGVVVVVGEAERKKPPKTHPLRLVHVALVADENLVHVLVRVPFNLLHPRLYAVEAVPVGHVVDEEDALGDVGGWVRMGWGVVDSPPHFPTEHAPARPESTTL